MNKIKSLLFLIFISIPLFSQHAFRAIVKDAETKEILIGATCSLEGSQLGAVSDVNGWVELQNIPDGKQRFVFSYVGYSAKELTLEFPKDNASVEIFLEPESHEFEEVIVSATRSSRTIDDIPTRVETISAEELDEKISMQPANAKMILTESTGIQTQQTSAVSANASIRIQGLDGKYTQLLKDGFPLYSGYSGGLSIVQIPPLDLKRVEVIKGSSSTLYGGGAIAGLINFVTKAPAEEKELSFLINLNTTNAQDINGFYSEKFEKTGVTIFASQNLQQAHDVDNNQLSDIPKFWRYNLNPTFYYYIDTSSTLSFGLNTNVENREGGDMFYLKNKADSFHSYFERNESKRISSQLKYEKNFSNKGKLSFKNSVSYFDRKISEPQYDFAARQISSFSELSYLIEKNRSEWIMGSNIWTDDFKQTNKSSFPLKNQLFIAGIFGQNSYKASEKVIVETGLRADVTNQKSYFVLPRLSFLFKISPKFSSRIGGGLGYKTPSIFSEVTEERAFQNIENINFNKVEAEKSWGANFDFNYKSLLFDYVSFSINQLFFITRLNKPLILNDIPLSNGNLEFINANGYLESKGLETNMKLGFEDISFYCGYTFIDAKRHFDDVVTLNPLTAKKRIYMTLMYELEKKLRVGYELFYTGKQMLNNGEYRTDYWIMGISAEYWYKKFAFFINAENFTDTRQSRFEDIYTGSLQNPSFKEIWAPIDGFIFNGGIKISIF